MYAASHRAAGWGRAFVVAPALALLFSASGALALTVTESESGEFSSDWAAPTEIGAGVDRIEGIGSGNAYDIFHFTGLSAGAQELTFSFVAPEEIDESYSAGGEIRWSEEAFRWGWDGAATTPAIQVDYYTGPQTLTLSLADDFAGELWLGLYFTHGASLAYTILADVTGVGEGDLGAGGPGAQPDVGAPSDGDSASAVPLPPALAMLGAGLAALGVAARRRRATA
ncbi:hypothetical protein P2H44_12740 [Albimonas sp. CAU 1670]|uniref:hypothetical protein n=1 Tax=Albimonas sp. CAU 1670 TaxID=3032599 RepID=UPI0023DC87D9|nr:hypothetical protein [Albimonas sp. CAU 1670]MDF2233420.1 hypothetical protein [Albimonas sp. CAU 1670]